MTVQAEDPELQQPSRHRRFVALLYADLCGSTRLATELEPELYADILDALKDIYRAVVPKYDGTLLQVHGDGQMSMFGHPHAGEEDVRLAVDAALELHQRVRELVLAVPDLPDDLQLRLHSGVHAGVALVQHGDIHGGSYQLRGDVTNICARLSQDAGEDEILVCSNSLRGSEPFYVLGKTRELTLKGVDRPMLACPVLGASELTTRYQARRQRSRLPLLGRESELAELQTTLRLAGSGRVSLLYVVGSPGVGKTRLVDEFLSGDGCSGQVIVRGACTASAASEPLAPFLGMLREAHHSAPLLHAAALQDDALQSALQTFAADPATADALIDAFLGFVSRRCAQDPMVMFLDDWHWADETSRRLLSLLVAQRDLPLLVVVATRVMSPGESEMFEPAAVIELDGLEDEAFSAALSVLLPAVDPFVAEKIRSLSGGNPLFIEELCQASSLDLLDARPSPVPYAPQWLYALVQARIGELDPVAQRIVQVAAVIGDVAPGWLLRAVAEFEDPGVLSGPTLLDLMYPSERGESWRFKHGLTRAIAYDLVGMRERQRLHRTIAQKLLEHHARDLPHEALAFHFAAAGMRDEAVHHARQAGERAMAIPALDVARTQYRAAMSLLDHGEINLPVYEQMMAVGKRLSYAAIFDPGMEELPLFERILDLARTRDDVKGQANANYWLGRVYYGLGRPRRALRYFFQARTLAQTCGFERLVAETDVALGQATAANCQHEAAVKLLERVTAERGEVAANSPLASGTAYALGCLGMVLGDQGHFNRAAEKFAAARAIIGGSGNPTEANVLAKLAAVQIWSLDWDAAVATAEQVARVSERIKNLYLFGMSRMLGAYAMWRRDGDETQVAVMRDTTRWLEAQHQGQFLSLNYGHLAEGYAALGAVAQARGYAARALARAREGDAFGLAVACRALAELAAEHGWPRPPAHYLRLAQLSAAGRASPREQALNAACADRLGVDLQTVVTGSAL